MMTLLDQDAELRRLLAPLAEVEPVTLPRHRHTRRRATAIGLLATALVATGVAVAAGLNPFAATSQQPSVNSCTATWNQTVPSTLRSQLIASRSRRGYVTPILNENQGTPLVWPECSYSFPLPDGRTLNLTEIKFRNGRPTWLGPPRILPLGLSVQLNTTVSPSGYLLKG